MAITGNLRTMQLSELLQWLSMGQKTGTLLVRGKSGEKRIYFDQGRIISSSSTVEREYLGHFLVAHGFITEEELTRAMEVQEESKILLGKILVMIGAISEEDLAAILRLKAAETIYDIFLWNEGAFEFADGNLPNLPMVPISVDVTGLVMEGLRRFDEWSRIRTRIGSHREIPAIVAPIEVGPLSERDRIVLRAIDGSRSISEIGTCTHNSEFFVSSFLFHLMDAGQAEIVGARSPRPDTVEMPAEEAEEDPTVFEEAQEAPYDAETTHDSEFSLRLPPTPQVPKPAPAAPTPPPIAESAAESTASKARRGDFARFLRRPDSTSTTDRQRRETGESASFRGLNDPSSTLRPGAGGPPPAAGTPAVQAPRIRQAAVPVLNRPMEDLMGCSFTPNEAFILSRINGLWDVRSITKISPFTETEVLRVFQKLEDGGVISWR